MRQYAIEPRTRKYFQGFWFSSFARKYTKTIIGYRTRCCKICFQKVLHKAGEFLGNKIADAVTKSNNDKIVKPGKKPRNVKEINISLKKRDEILKNLRKGLTETAKHEMKKARRQNFFSFVSTFSRFISATSNRDY